MALGLLLTQPALMRAAIVGMGACWTSRWRHWPRPTLSADGPCGSAMARTMG